MSNPSWVLSEKDTKELINRFAGKALPSIDAVEGVLGFRSFIIESESDDDTIIRKLQNTFRVGGALLDKFIAPEGLALPSLAIDEELIQHVESVVQTREKAMGQAKEESLEVEEEAAKSTKKAALAPCVIQNTAYNPGFWYNGSTGTG
jgi:hypothetical protein